MIRNQPEIRKRKQFIPLETLNCTDAHDKKMVAPRAPTVRGNSGILLKALTKPINISLNNTKSKCSDKFDLQTQSLQQTTKKPSSACRRPNGRVSLPFCGAKSCTFDCIV